VLDFCENRSGSIPDDWAYGLDEVEISKLEKTIQGLLISARCAYFTQVFGLIVLALALPILVSLVAYNLWHIVGDCRNCLGAVLHFLALRILSCKYQEYVESNKG